MSNFQVAGKTSFYPGMSVYNKPQWMQMSNVYGDNINNTNNIYNYNFINLNQSLSNNFNNVIGGDGCSCCCCKQQIGHIMPKRIKDDPYGVGQCGQGHRSNLANSPEALLALNDIFKNKDSQGYDAVAKDLREKYGIQADVGDIKTKDKDGKESTSKGIRFANGDYFVDSNGDNQLGTGDYKFTDAIKNLKEKYGVNDKYLNNYVDQMKERGSIMNELQHGNGNFGGGNNFGGGPFNNFNSGAFNDFGGGPFNDFGGGPFSNFGGGRSNNGGNSQMLILLMMMMFMQSYGMANYN